MMQKITYKDIFQNTSNGVLVTDNKGIITLVNHQAVLILNLSPHTHIGMFISDILPLTGSQVIKCLETGSPIIGHQVLGKETKLMVNITPFFKQKKIRGAICNFQELSVFESSAKNLESYKRLNRQLETIIHASSDGIWVSDENGEIVHVNEASERLNGINAADVMGKKIYDLVGKGYFDRSVTIKVLESKQQESILQHVQKTGKLLLVTGTPAFDENGRIYLVVVNERDITELNMLRKEIENKSLITEKYKEELADLSILELKKNEFIAENSRMRQILRMALKLSRINATSILILGESGTGKGLLAKFIHKNSERNKSPFVQVNCAALPENLLEAELFGYEKGAFTGASEKGKIGLFELAQGGTLFLDEIGDMPLSIQAKLLTCLDDNKIRRLGSTKSIKIECSIIAATNQNPEVLIRKKMFREDLYYRLNSFILNIPPLRKRPEDIFELSEYYLKQYNRTYKTGKKIRSKGMTAMQSYGFPGNVRELKSIIKTSVVMSDNEVIDATILNSLNKNRSIPRTNPKHDATKSLKDKMNETERELLIEAMNQCKSTREMAKILGISQPTVVRKMRKYKLSYGVD